MKNFPLYPFFFAGDWQKTEKVIELNLSNKPCITAEIYPNKNQGRIILSTVHPEYLIWKGGYIRQKDDTKFNCIGSGFYQWMGLEKYNKNILMDLTHNWWILRRLVAWAGKVPDSLLPPKFDNRILVDNNSLRNFYIWDGTKINQLRNI
jgi:hypothetical protein